MDITEIAAKFFQAKEKLSQVSLKLTNSQSPKDWQDYLTTRNEYALAKQELALAKCEEYVINYDIGCVPNLSNSKEFVLQSQQSLFLSFRAISLTPSFSKEYDDLGIVTIEFQQYLANKSLLFNQHTLENHPLYAKGLDECLGIGEVINSLWLSQLREQDFILELKDLKQLKHYVFMLKTSIFECIAPKINISFSLADYPTIINDICKKHFSL